MEIIFVFVSLVQNSSYLRFRFNRKMLNHQNIVDATGGFFSFLYGRMNPHVIVVYKCVLVRSADVLR